MRLTKEGTSLLKALGDAHLLDRVLHADLLVLLEARGDPNLVLALDGHVKDPLYAEAVQLLLLGRQRRVRPKVEEARDDGRDNEARR